MGAPAKIHHSVCPHDCPSTCALEVELHDAHTIGRVRGARDNTYTTGVICSKVARYAERIHHPDRLLTPLRRSGPRDSGQFRPVAWDDALDEVAEAFLRAEQKHGSTTVWPYYYAGTMGLVMRDGINRLRHAKRYSGQHSTICVTLSWSGFLAGTGRLAGADPREMARADAVVIWGTNAASTQVNVMTHALRARRERGAKLVVVDTYRNATAEQADMFLCVRPGTDGALACATMHCLFRDGRADWPYLEQYTDCPRELAAHLASRTPAWASAICGVPAAEIEAFAALLGRTPRSYFRLGYGFSRQRNGAMNMHAALCIPTVMGAWRHEGGGAFHTNGAIFHWDRTLIEGNDVRDPSVRVLDQSRIGAVLTHDAGALRGGPPVTALLIQNTNPMSVAPDQNTVRRGFLREDLFTCVHEQFMTETARMADIVLPATMFLEHDDLYQGGGHQHILLGPRIVEPPGECRSNHDVICALAQRLGAAHEGFRMTSREIIDWTLQHSGWGSLDALESARWLDVQPDFETAHYLKGFAHADGRFHFAADWRALSPQGHGAETLPSNGLPDHHALIEEATAEMPFRLVTAPARNFLNSSFTETPTSSRREVAPTLLMHPEDAVQVGVTDGGPVIVGNLRGEVELVVRSFDGLRRGVVVCEGIWPNRSHPGGLGINALTGADPAGPIGGAAFHDNRVWIRARTPAEVH